MLVINLATRGRPELLLETVKRTLENVWRTDTVMMISADADDPATLDAVGKSGLPVVLDIRERELGLGEKFNRCIDRFPDASVYLAAVDDARHVTRGFDQKILEAAQTYPDGICLIQNRLYNMFFPEINAVTRRWVEIVGFFYPPWFPFAYIDHWVDGVARMTGRVAYVEIEVDTSSAPGTQNKRDVSFWSEFLGKTAAIREAHARRLIAAMDVPGWQKEALIRNFPLVRDRDTKLNRLVMLGNMGAEETPDDERHQAARARAQAVIAELGEEPLKEDLWRYYPEVFSEIPDEATARQLILSPENALSSEERWEQETPWLIDKIKSHLNPGMTIDFGCGIGRLMKQLPGPLIGIDISHQMLMIALKYVARSDCAFATPGGLASMVEFGFRANNALAVWALQHIPDPAAALELLHRALNTGGILWIVDHGKQHLPVKDKGGRFGWASSERDVRPLIIPHFSELHFEWMPADMCNAGASISCWRKL